MKTLGMMVVAAVLLSGCATTHTSYAPDGRKAYTLNCSGLARGWDKCYAAAGNLCGAAGYDTIDRSSEEEGFANAGSSWGAHAYRGHDRSMVIACKLPATAAN